MYPHSLNSSQNRLLPESPPNRKKKPVSSRPELSEELAALVQPISEAGVSDEEKEYFDIENKEVALFLGKIERKPVHSVVMTLDAPEGSGKTRAAFQVLGAMAESGYNCLFVSLEEHRDSDLLGQKCDKYLSKKVQEYIVCVSELPQGYDTLVNLAPHFDCIFIDSWGKVEGGQGKLDFFRKSQDGKFMFIIYQRTSKGTMRGGSDSAFDGDMICKAYKDPDYKNNYLYWSKNRYSSNAKYCYLIHEKVCISSETGE